jgi:hypothetical protein
MSDISLDANQIDRQVVESPELLGKECVTCQRILAFKFFRHDHTFRDGYRDQCAICASEPCLSMAEQVLRTREKNNNSEAIKSQRVAHQEDYKNDAARIGKTMTHADFLYKLGKLLPMLRFIEGRVHTDIAVFRIHDQPQAHLGGRMFEYLFYIPEGTMPEFSQYEFDTVRDVRLKEKQRGWRTPLLRLIRSGFLTEGICDAVFGPALGEASAAWYRELWIHRNNQMA